MKRRTVKALVCATLMAMSLSATACGGSDDAAGNADTATEEAASTEEETPAAEEEAPAEEETPAEDEVTAEEENTEEEEAGGETTTLEDYLKGDAETEKELEEQAQSMSNESMDMEIEVEGNNLIYVATLKEDIENADAMVEAINEQLGSTFSALAGMLDEVVEAEKGTVSISIRYCAPDGSVIGEASFSAE